MTVLIRHTDAEPMNLWDNVNCAALNAESIVIAKWVFMKNSCYGNTAKTLEMWKCHAK